VASFLLERFFLDVIRAVSKLQDAILAAVQDQLTSKVVEEFLTDTVRAKFPSMSAVDRILQIPAVKDAVWEMGCTVHCFCRSKRL